LAKLFSTQFKRFAARMRFDLKQRGTKACDILVATPLQLWRAIL